MVGECGLVGLGGQEGGLGGWSELDVRYAGAVRGLVTGFQDALVDPECGLRSLPDGVGVAAIECSPDRSRSRNEPRLNYRCQTP